MLIERSLISAGEYNTVYPLSEKVNKLRVVGEITERTQP